MEKFLNWCVDLMGWKIFRHRQQKLLAVVVCLSMIATFMLWLPLNGQTIAKPELRGVWLTNIDSNLLFERDCLQRCIPGNRLKNALQRLDDLKFNTVYPVVWNWGYTLYPSQVAAKVIGRAMDPEPGLQGRNMLKEVVTEGHKKGFKVIP